jgi:phosphatidylglycerol:prolipoprotein diacylglycerol transferase
VHTTFLQFGHLHIPVFGVVVAIGLMASLSLTQWSARRVGLDADRVWNTAMLAVVAVFVVSRLLLVVFNFRSFLEYPLLLLAVPSLTSLGIVVSTALVYGYVRWRGVPLLPLLDSCAASVALLWAFVNAAFLFDGTHDGMPVGAPSAPQPVEVYTLVAALVILLAVLNALRSGYRGGEATGLALTASGLAIFFIDFYRLPSELLPSLPIDPSQIIALVMVAVGGALLYRVATRLYAQIHEPDEREG